MNYTNIRHGLLLTLNQYAVLENDNHGFHRMTAFRSLMELAAIEPYTYTKGSYSINLTEGQVAISKVELSRLWHCDDETALKVIRIFEAAGLLSTFANNRTTIITVRCLAFWLVDEGERLDKVIKNRHYERRPVVKEYKPVKKEKTNKPTVQKTNEEAEASAPEEVAKGDEVLDSEIVQPETAEQHIVESKSSEPTVPTVSVERSESGGERPSLFPPSKDEVKEKTKPECNAQSQFSHNQNNRGMYHSSNLADRKKQKGFASPNRH